MKFNFDYNTKTKKTDDYFKFSIGSCHAATALREDYRKQLAETHKELGFKYIRFHGLFNDDMCVIRKSLFSNDYVLSFVNIDSIYDYLLSIGMKPFVELGFMPSCLKSGDETIFHYKGNVTPPSDYDTWSWFISEFIKHIVNRYGLKEVRTWFFEVWNEPNLCKESGFAGGRFWSADMDEYYKLYSYTVKAIKAVDNKLKVGGPATSNNAFIPEFINHCKENNLPCDFITTHHYPTDVVLGYGVEDSQNFITAFNNTKEKDKLKKLLQEYITFAADTWSKVDRGVVTDMTKRAVSEAGELPLYYTEWSSLSGLDSDGPFGASFIAKTINDNADLVKGYSYWTFSDIFEEKGMPNCEFHGGYGLMTVNGIKKAPYNAYKLLNMLGDERYTIDFNEKTVDIYSYKDTLSNTLQFMIINHHSLLHDFNDEEVTIKLNNCDILNKAELIRVDDDHANPVKLWHELGNHEYPSEAEILQLKAKSCLEVENIEIKDNEITLVVPKQGIAYLNIYLK